MNTLNTPKASSSNWAWFLVWGIALVLLGVLAVVYAASTTIISVIFLGALLTVTGAILVFDSFKSNWGKWNDFFLRLGIGVLYLVAGVILIKGPVIGSLTLTLILAIFYIILGLFRTIYCLSHSMISRGWRLASGLVTLLLGILILLEWPMSGLFIIGLFIGIDLIFTGWIFIIGALTAKSQS